MKRASVSIEAAISLVVLMSVMITLNTFIRVTYIHSVVQHALVQVGNEMATYDYVMSLLGFSAVNRAAATKAHDMSQQSTDLNNASAEKIVQAKDVGEKLNQFSSVIDDLSGGNTEAANSIVSSANDLQESAETFTDFSSLKEALYNGTDKNGNKTINIKTLLKSYVAGFAGEGMSVAKTSALNLLTEAIFSGYIDDNILNKNIVYANSSPGDDNDAFIAGLDFSQSKYFEYPNVDCIELCCSYMIKVPSPIPIIEYVPMVNTVRVRAWQDKWNEVEEELRTSVWVADRDDKEKNIDETYKVFRDSYCPEGIDSSKNTTLTYFDKSTGVAYAGNSYNLIYSYKEDKTRSMLSKKLNSVLNYKSSEIQCIESGNITNETVSPSDIKKAVVYVFVPDVTAVDATEDGRKLTELKNKLAKGESKENTEDIKNEIKELEQKVDAEKKSLKEKIEQVKKDLPEIEEDFNDGSDFKIEIVLKVVDSPA